LIVGGAQENTLLTVDMLKNSPEYKDRYLVDLVSGPQTGPEGSLAEEARQRGITVRIIPELVRQPSPVKDFKVILKLRRLMTDSHGRPRYDIVHTHSSKAGVLGRIAAHCAGIPLIVHTVHGWSFHEHMSLGQLYSFIMLEKLAARFTHRMIFVSYHDIAKGLAHGIRLPNDNIVIRSGIELTRFGNPRITPKEMRRQLGIPADAAVVGSVTRLSPQKAPLDMIDAFARIHQSYPDVWFILAGDGPLRREVEQRIQAAGIAGQTVLTGIRRDIPEILSVLDIFVLSSLWEGLPRVLPQAMATGLPIVCTRTDGSAEAVSDGINGYLVEPGNPDEIAERVNGLLCNPVLRKSMGEEGRFRAQEFSSMKMVREIDMMYRDLLDTDTSISPILSQYGGENNRREHPDIAVNEIKVP
jgi:glycosyltransferase involved in cell wall biosynthesis